MPLCAKCNKSIKPATLAVTVGKDSLHPTCIYCNICKKPLWGQPFKRLKDGKLACESSCQEAPNATYQNAAFSSSSEYESSSSNNNPRRQFDDFDYQSPIKSNNRNPTYQVFELPTASYDNFTGMPPPPLVQQQQTQQPLMAPQFNQYFPPSLQPQPNGFYMPPPANLVQQRVPTTYGNMPPPPPIHPLSQQQQQQLPPQPLPNQAPLFPRQLSLFYNKMCHLCNKSVFNKRYITYENGEIYCAECDAHLANSPLRQRQQQQQQQQLPLNPQMFLCSVCEQVKDKRFLTEPNGRIVCEDCNKNAIRCDHCNQLFKNNELMRHLPNGKRFHDYCFFCNECKRQIGKSDFYFSEDPSVGPQSGYPVCENCFDSVGKKPNCGICTSPIEGPYLMIDNVKPIHEDCFKCSDCKIPLDKKIGYYRSLTNPNMPACKNCSLKTRIPSDKNCAKCSKSILEQDGVTFSNKNYHQGCFKCDKCDTDLTKMKNTFTDRDDQNIYCQPCFIKYFSPKCSKCNLSIPPNEAGINFENKLYHKECFCCARCKKSLKSKKFFKSGNIIVCEDCY